MVAGQLRNEYVLAISGVVESRGDNVNPRMKTGEIEVLARKAEIMNAAELTPFHVQMTSTPLRNSVSSIGFSTRRPQLQQVLMLRSRVNGVVRNALMEEGFLELETPILTKATPEGARDYLVPELVTQTTSMRCLRARSCSSSCLWWQDTIAIFRSVAAFGTKTSGLTGSQSSPRSISKWPL